MCDISFGNTRGYPILTAPLAGKGERDLVCPAAHIEYVKTFLADCEKILVIGISGLDDDLLELIRVSGVMPQLIHYVGWKDTEQVAGRFRTGIPQLDEKFVAQELVDDGFVKYLSSPKFERFLRFDTTEQH